MASPTTRKASLLPLVTLAAVGASVLLTAHMSARDPRYLIPLVVMLALSVVPAFLARARMRRLLRSGDVKLVLGSWKGSIERIAHAETISPLMAATAYASYGWVEAAHDSLRRAVKGPAWDAALEQRLFVETLLDAFGGNRAAALEKAEALAKLPMPAKGPLARRRVGVLRRGLGALARAFAHCSGEGDARLLERAAGVSPLVHWAMRYAAAIVEVDHGQPGRARTLLEGAPSWPKESAFRAYHDELLAHAA